MGKKSRELVRGKGYLGKLVKKTVEKVRSNENVKDIIEKGKTIEDKDCIIKFLNPRKQIMIPKNMTVEELHIEIIKRLDKRKLADKINVYISEDGKGVIMEI